ncbi:hypothetical protein FRX31_011718 [Thalictrum thalictroides]|uniref:Uncharacterized protein n=1 Tax=Thalictrum thalictroides TaxID=46969 RepID=A0A7J6WP19_THATH|nr:hypothetical protein FRX31_011718 [Thalictrum thalictroides]
MFLRRMPSTAIWGAISRNWDLCFRGISQRTCHTNLKSTLKYSLGLQWHNSTTLPSIPEIAWATHQTFPLYQATRESHTSM